MTDGQTDHVTVTCAVIGSKYWHYLFGGLTQHNKWVGCCAHLATSPVNSHRNL